MRAFLSQIRTRLILGALVFLLALTGAVILAVRDSLLFTGRDTARLGAEGFLQQTEALLLEIARREAEVSSLLVSANPADLNRLNQRLAGLGLTPNAFGFVLDARGRLAAVTPGHGAALFGASGADAPWVGQALQDTSSESLRRALTEMLAGRSAAARLEVAGSPMVIAYAPLTGFGGALAIVVPEADIIARAEPLSASIQSHVGDILRATLLTIAYFAALAMLGAVVAARALTSPFQTLLAGTRAIAAGDLSVRLPPGSSDEFGVLARSFNQMADKLQARSAELAEAYQLLEQRVEERTRELGSLLQISRTIVSTLELDPLLGLVLEQLKLVVDYSAATVASLQDEAFVVRAYRGPGPAAPFLALAYPIHAPLEAEIAQTRRPLIIADIHADTPHAALFRQQAGPQMESLFGGLHAWMRLPLIARGTLIGMLTLHHREPAAFTAKHADLALAFAGLAAVTLENARLYEQARALAAVEERQRLARDLHDSVTQSLYSLTLLAEAARRTALAGEVPKAVGHVERLGDTAQQALKEMRLLVYQLRPLALEQAGLVEALQHRLDAVEKRAGVRAQLRVALARSLSPVVEAALYRLAQEALNNALKHAGAATVTVTLADSPRGVEMEIVDDGRGFDVQALSDQGGLGLLSLRERAAALDGHCEVTSAAGKGTRVWVALPC